MIIKERTPVMPPFGRDYKAKILRKVVENYERTRVELVSAIDKMLEHNDLSSREFCQEGKYLCKTKPFRSTSERKLPPLPNGDWVEKEAIFCFPQWKGEVLIRIPIEGDITSSKYPHTQTVFAVEYYQNGILQAQQLETLDNSNMYGDAGVYLVAKSALEEADYDGSKMEAEKIEPARPFLTLLGMISCAFRYTYEE